MTVNFTFWLIMVLSASVIANIFAFWYIRRVLAKLMFVGENLSDLVDLLSAYREHLKGIYQLEQFYGDDDIKFVISHTTSLIELLEQEYGDVYSMTTIQEDEETEEETNNDAEKEISQKDVFYAGARESNS
jgi:hypothetical protein